MVAQGKMLSLKLIRQELFSSTLLQLPTIIPSPLLFSSLKQKRCRIIIIIIIACICSLPPRSHSTHTLYPTILGQHPISRASILQHHPERKYSARSEMDSAKANHDLPGKTNRQIQAWEYKQQHDDLQVPDTCSKCRD